VRVEIEHDISPQNVNVLSDFKRVLKNNVQAKECFKLYLNSRSKEQVDGRKLVQKAETRAARIVKLVSRLAEVESAR
jgi:hypothetical protein